MFRKLMVPVDLGHLDSLARSLECAADLAHHYSAEVTYVGVTAPGWTSIATGPDHFRSQLNAFAMEQAARTGVPTQAHAVIAGDPVTEVDDALIEVAQDIGADLIVMATHVPKLSDYVWPSNGGRVARRVSCSVMLVRP